ncbi:MAG: nuclear transport factor 2 family protein [Candidatus Xenobia bacterium]
MTPEAIAQTVSAYFDAASKRDVERWLQAFSPDAENHDPLDGQPVRGHEALRQYFTMTSDVLQSFSVEADNIFVSGHGAAVKFSASATVRDRNVTFEGIEVFEFNAEGKIQRMWGYWNPAALLAQLQS